MRKYGWVVFLITIIHQNALAFPRKIAYIRGVRGIATTGGEERFALLLLKL